MTGVNRRRASRHSTADENIFICSRPVIYRPTVPGATASYCGARHAQPVHLFVSGCAAPQDRSHSRHLHALPDDELLQELKEYNGTPPEIMANRALMDLILPTLRADFMLAEVYTYRAAPRLAMPITVFSGRADPHISETQAQSWAKETSASCDVTFFDGDHFFINHERQAILESVSRELAEKERV